MSLLDKGISSLILSSILFWSSTVMSTVIVTGDLSYNDTTDIITDTVSGEMYLGWDVLQRLTYAETIAATTAGGSYSMWHIASQEEAYDFYHAAGGVGEDMDSSDPFGVGTPNNGRVNGFGANYFRDPFYSYAFFLSNENRAGALFNTADYIGINNSWSSIVGTDFYSDIHDHGDYISWLLVSDSVSTVPVPAAVWLFGSGLLGLIGVARRK